MSLKQRVLEAAESARQQKIEREIAAIRFSLRQMGVIPSLTCGQVKIDKHDTVFVLYEDLAFSMREITHYDEHGYKVVKTEHVIDVKKACPVEGCERFLYRPYLNDVRSLAQLAELYPDEVKVGFKDCGRHGEHFIPTGDDDDLMDLPW